MAAALHFRHPVNRDIDRGTDRDIDRGTDHDPAGLRPGTVAAGVVAVVILVGAGAVALSGGNNPSTPAGNPVNALAVLATATSTVTALPSASAAVATQSVLANAAGSPLLVAPKVNWQLFAGVPLPYSPTAGPLNIDGPVASGFARSQAGALIAAVQLGTRYLLTPGEGWRQVLQRQVLPGVGREVFARLRATVDSVAPPGSYGQPAGFRFVAYTPEVAAIQLVSRFPTTGSLQVVVVTVMWVGGDWRLQLQPDGGSSPTAQAVPNLDGFVVWGI
jgi:hypothetical protein